VFIAVISGRSVDNVKELVGISDITYAGNHGLEILHPDGTKFVHPMPMAYEDKVSNLLKELQDEVRRQTKTSRQIITFKSKILNCVYFFHFSISCVMMVLGLRTRGPF